MDKVLIYGAYGMDNLGDDFMVECIKSKIKKNNIKPVLFKRNNEKYYFNCIEEEKYFFPLEIRYKSKFKKIKETIKWIFNTNLHKEYKALIFMGGGYINEQFGIKNLIRIYLLCLKHRKNNIYFTGQSVGPYKSFLGKILIKQIYMFGDKIAVREKTSSTYLSKEKIEHKLIGDDAFLFCYDGREKSNAKYVIFNCKDFKNYDTYKNNYFNFLLGVSRKCKNKVLIIPFRSEVNSNEYKINLELFNFLKMNKIDCLFVVEKDLNKFIDYYFSSNLTIGTAYHSIVLGLIANKELRKKVFGF